MDELLQEFINKRPEVKAAYGYGSAIFKQANTDNKELKQLDLILVVDDLKKWHLDNLKMNIKDYPLFGSIYYKTADINELKGCTGITYLSNIKENNKIFKYGTIEKDDLIEKLITWNSFYVPGRFQKPIYPIKEDQELNMAIHYNRKMALIISAYLSEKDIVSKKDIYKIICSLSYMGDTRMSFAENPHKIKNIVNGSYNEFEKIYEFNRPYFEKIDDNYVEIDREYLNYYINYDGNLPKALIDIINYNTNIDSKDNIINYLYNLNKKESIKQAIKAIDTNGLIRSINYGSRKLVKRFKH